MQTIWCRPTYSTFMFTEQEHLQPSTIITCAEQRLVALSSPLSSFVCMKKRPSETLALIFADKPKLLDSWITPKRAAKHLVWLRSPPLLTLHKASRGNIKQFRHSLSVAPDASIREMQQWKRTKGKTDVFCNAWCGLCDLQAVLSTALKVRIAARITSCQ